MPLVDGMQASEDSYGIVQGNGGEVDRVSGDSSDNMLQGNAEHNYYYGGAGNDTFKLMAHAAQQGEDTGQSTAYDDQFAVIFDFEGAGVAGGDFIVFDGFDATSLKLEHVGTSGTPGAVHYYYSVQDMEGNTHNFLVNSLTGQELGAGDFNFY